MLLVILKNKPGGRPPQFENPTLIQKMWQILNARVRYVIVKTMSRIIKIPQIKFEQVILIEPLKLKNTHANTII